MIRLRGAVVASTALVVTALAAGAGLAVSQSGPGPTGDGAAGDKLATGTTAAGAPYTISWMTEESLARAEQAGGIPDGLLCLEVEANAMRGGGCLARPHLVESFEPTQTTLADAMIVYGLVDDGVAALEVRLADRPHGPAQTSGAVDVGSARLVHAPVGAVLPADAGSRPHEPPPLDLRLIDADGKVVERQTFDAAGFDQ